MITISDAFKLSYKNFAGIHTKIQIGTTLYSDSDIVEGTLALTESVCSGEEINLRSVEKSSLRFSLFTSQSTTDLKGKSLIAYQECDGESETLPLGAYIIDDARRKGQEIAITAYDNMGKFEQDVSAWYSGITFPISIRDMIISLAAYVGVSTGALPASWTNSGFQIPDFATGEITGTQIIAYAQEVSAGFFRCNRSGSLTFVAIDVSSTVQSYQPQDVEQGSVEIADYSCETIDQLQIFTSSDHSSDIIVGSGSNVYVLDNPMLYGLTDNTVASAIYAALSQITYTPFRGDLVETYPWVEVGDTVSVTTYDGESATAPLLKRSLSGSKLGRGTVESHGLMLRSKAMPLNERINEDYNALDSRVTALEQGGGGGGTATGVEAIQNLIIRMLESAGGAVKGLLKMTYYSGVSPWNKLTISNAGYESGSSKTREELEFFDEYIDATHSVHQASLAIKAADGVTDRTHLIIDDDSVLLSTFNGRSGYDRENTEIYGDLEKVGIKHEAGDANNPRIRGMIEFTETGFSIKGRIPMNGARVAAEIIFQSTTANPDGELTITLTRGTTSPDQAVITLTPRKVEVTAPDGFYVNGNRIA
ncbi:MAG: hypothetical protein IKF39_02430 [Oscillospiraceae bacterium]|nr:hypothetical protein [Oscillospiraceae bacterium]